jgi:hypothetical protein
LICIKARHGLSRKHGAAERDDTQGDPRPAPRPSAIAWERRDGVPDTPVCRARAGWEDAMRKTDGTTGKALREAAAAMAAATGQTIDAARALVAAEMALIAALAQPVGRARASRDGAGEEPDAGFDNMPV